MLLFGVLITPIEVIINRSDRGIFSLQFGFLAWLKRLITLKLSVSSSSFVLLAFFGLLESCSNQQT